MELKTRLTRQRIAFGSMRLLLDLPLTGTSNHSNHKLTQAPQSGGKHGGKPRFACTSEAAGEPHESPASESLESARAGDPGQIMPYKRLGGKPRAGEKRLFCQNSAQV